MKVLWVATKAPWPPEDGGRLLLYNSLAALTEAGHRITLVAPVDPATDRRALRDALAPVCDARLVAARSQGMAMAWLAANLRGLPATIVRHRRPAVRRAVAAALAEDHYDVVQVEQVHAWPQVPTGPDVPPVVVRAQNVESTLWRATAQAERTPSRAWRVPLLRREAGRLARYEGRVLATAAGAIALTAADADQLAGLTGGRRPTVVPAPFADRLPAAEAPLGGDPAVVMLGSGAWPPNRDGARWFVDAVWPAVTAAEARAQLHVFGAGLVHRADATIAVHPAPADSREAFAPDSVLVVPLRVASGVRMKILEAWARGIPVVATPGAARGLEAQHGRELLVAADAAAFSEAIVSLRPSSPRRQQIVAAGRRRLRKTYGPALVATAIEAAWQAAIDAG